MKHPALIIVKPDGVRKRLIGNVLTKFGETGLQIIAARVINATRALPVNTIGILKVSHFSNRPFPTFVVNFIMKKNY